MEKKKVELAAEVKKDEALKESFAEIQKAAATEKLAETKKEEKPAAEPKKRGRKPAAEKKAETVAKAEKKAEPAKAEKKPAAKAKKPAAKAAEPKLSVTLEFNGKQFNVEDVQKQALKAAKKAKKDAKKVEVYVVANQSAAYYVVDGEGKEEYRINL